MTPSTNPSSPSHQHLEWAYLAIPPGWKIELIQKSQRSRYHKARLVNAIGGCIIEVKAAQDFHELVYLLIQRLRAEGYYA